MELVNGFYGNRENIWIIGNHPGYSYSTEAL
jgi:hypothetical protein